MAITVEANDIFDLIAQEGLIDRATLSPETQLDKLAIPSLDMLNILFALESKYDITLEADDLKNAVVLSDLVSVVKARVESAGGTAP